MLLNNRIAPFDNELVRRAFSYAVDRDQFIRGVAGGFSSARATLIADDSPHSISNVENGLLPAEHRQGTRAAGAGRLPRRHRVRADVAPHRAAVGDRGADHPGLGQGRGDRHHAQGRGGGDAADPAARLARLPGRLLGHRGQAHLLPLAVGLDRPSALALRRHPRGPSRVVAAAAGRDRARTGRIPGRRSPTWCASTRRGSSC